MLLAIDVGNSQITFAVITGGEVAEPRQVASGTFESPDGLASSLGGLDDVDEVVLASVVPRLTTLFLEVARVREIRLLVADETTVPIEARVERPAEVGADRLVNALAAARLYGTPAIVVDLGTATTFDVVSADGAYIGGAIAPGLEISVDALAERTAQLPRIPLDDPAAAIGRNTVAAMQSGAILGHVWLVRGLVEAISDELGAPPKVILTGGLSRAPWVGRIGGITAVDPQLTLRGLAIVHAEAGTGAAVPAATGPGA